MARTVATLFVFLVMLLPRTAETQEISGLDVRLNNGEIQVSFTVSLEQQKVKEIREGIEKDLKLYIDLFRIWKIWPDEFVTGKSFSRTLKSDPIKGEYVATSLSGNVLLEKRFRSFDSMLVWALSVKDLKLANTRELEPGKYYVKVTAESRIRKLPPVITYFMVFLSENEFKISRDSGIFMVEGSR